MENMGEFKKDKQYIFSYKKFIKDTNDTTSHWPKAANGQPVRVISEDTGLVYVYLIPDIYPAEFHIVAKWCEETSEFNSKFINKIDEVHKNTKDKLLEDKTEFAFVKHEHYRGKLNKILNYLQARDYQICTEVYLKDKIEIRMYSLIHNRHVKIENDGVDSYSVNYYKEIYEI